MDPEVLARAWNSYAEAIRKSRPRIFSTLTNNRPRVEKNGTVSVALNSEAQREHFVKHIRSALTSHILRETGWPHLEIKAELSVSESNGKKIYTDQDKLEYLIRKNPELGWLKSRFNLDFDD